MSVPVVRSRRIGKLRRAPAPELLGNCGPALRERPKIIAADVADYLLRELTTAADSGKAVLVDGGEKSIKARGDIPPVRT